MSLPEPIRPILQRIIYRAPFLAHLAMALRWRMDPEIETACTNGVEVRVNPDFLESLPPAHRASVLAHEALHCALRHAPRGARLIQTPMDAARFNVAADIVVNGALSKAGMELPPGCIRDRNLEHLSVEEVYRALKSGSRMRIMGRILGSRLRDLDAQSGAIPGEGSEAGSEVDWDTVIRRADLLARQQAGKRAGSAALGIDRELGVAMGEVQIDWRTILWRFLAACPNDWGGWDRRMVWTGLYNPVLVGQGLRAVVGIDTSGSIDNKLLKAFLAELSGILDSVESLEIDLYWTDLDLYGPVTLEIGADLSELEPRGGGGTDLAPLFREAERIAQEGTQPLLPVIYLTDGLGPTLAHEPPGVSALWVIPTSGRIEQPFGEVVTIEVGR
jgi:predicted metal-dependent peptidase